MSARVETLVITATDQAGNAESVEVPLSWTADVGMLVGVHVEGASSAPWNIVRCYNQGMIDAAPASMGIAASYSTICHPGWPSSSSAVSQVQAGLQSLPDRPNMWACMCHEMEHPGEKYAGQQSQYIADEVVFARMVRGLKRTHPVSIYRNAMAFSVLPAQATLRGIDGFFASGDYDAVGMDVYSNTQIQAAIDYAAKWHKPLVIPEQGLESAIPHTDLAVLTYMQRSIPLYQSAGARFLTWFDHTGSGAELSQYPDGLAYLKSQIA